jgi:putative nucleotidyltransferase with HDIG domain
MCQRLANAVWTHSLQVAATAQILAARFTRLNPDEALFAGIVHDIGYFYLMSRLPEFGELARHPERANAVFSAWHAPIGVAVLHGFDLPDAVSDAIAQHEGCAYNVPLRSHRDVLCAANHLAAATNPALDGIQQVQPVASELASFMNEHQADWQALVAALR